MNQFGGNWTEEKMDIIVEYAKAYLTIMNKQSWVKTLYFDGFAGSGMIEIEEFEYSKGTALRILDLEEPKPFDLYYFVELNEYFKTKLEDIITDNYPNRNTHIVQADCNSKLKDMARFLQQNKNYRALAFIDPYGMSVNWDSITTLENLGIDLWILVPTGVGVNRLLKTDGKISEAWLFKLEKFLGLTKEIIFDYFYKTDIVHTLFGEDTFIQKEKNAIQKVGNIYSQKLKEVFKYVSEPFVLKNSSNSIMYHFMMATNNKAALNIANHVIKPKYKL